MQPPPIDEQVRDRAPACEPVVDAQTQAVAITRIAEWNLQIDALLERCRMLAYDEVTLVLRACRDFMADFGERENGLEDACELMAVLVSRLCDQCGVLPPS